MRIKSTAAMCVVLSSLFAVAVGNGCSKVMQPTVAENRYRKFTGTAYTSSGDRFNLIVDTRASRVAERQEFLPLQIAFLNRSQERISVFRESFVLETSDRTRIPLVAYSEFIENYPRHRVDLRVGISFLEAINGRYPSPPFTKRNLEFFPLRESGDVPRDDIHVRQGEMAIGFIYFRLPNQESLDELGDCRLLFTPGGEDTQYVLELQTYQRKKKKA